MDNAAGAHNDNEVPPESTQEGLGQGENEQETHGAEDAEWETEGSEEDEASFTSGSGGESSQYESYEDDMDDMEDMEDMDIMGDAGAGGVELMNLDMFLGEHGFGYQIESLGPNLRANKRPNVDDVMSEFSGDEKYEPKRTSTGDDGDGDMDMTDFTGAEHFSEQRTKDEGLLTLKIRHLMQKLTRGRGDREKKLKVEAWLDGSGKTTGASGRGENYLHRLIVRGEQHPQELEHSPAISNHSQCANSLVVTPSAMGVWDDVFTIAPNAVMRCGVLGRMTESTVLSRLMTAMENADPSLDTDQGRRAHEIVCRPYSQALRTIKASKFMRTSIYRFEIMPLNEAYVPLDEDEGPLCLAHRFGYLAHGTSSGELVVYCTSTSHEPFKIHQDMIERSRQAMLNSMQIVRWPRYRQVNPEQEDDASEQDDGPEDENDQFNAEQGYPSKAGQFDHYLVITGNERGLYIAALPDHPNSKDHNAADLDPDMDEDEHVFKFKEDHTWIRNGFGGEYLNDAKVSPDGRWIAIVGDAAKVWIIEVTHVEETEEQRLVREKREQEILMQDLAEVDFESEYSTDDSMEEVEAKLDIEDTETKSERQRKRFKTTVQESDEDGDKDSDADATSNSTDQPKEKPRLLHQFGQPEALQIPRNILFPPTKRRRRVNPRQRSTEYSSQYVAWNATSTKFAHTSDNNSHVVVWSMPAREIVCCVDIGGTGFSVEFHPKLENVFTCCNWYGFVHVVDLTGACVGDEELVPNDVHYNGQTDQGPALVGCQGPHYEEKHDILMLSFRGERDTSLRILDSIRGVGWSTDGRYLYVATLRRVLRYELLDGRVRIPSLFELCANKIREWRERVENQHLTGESDADLAKAYDPIPEEWEYVPYPVKRQIWGDLFHLRSHSE